MPATRLGNNKFLPGIGDSDPGNAKIPLGIIKKPIGNDNSDLGNTVSNPGIGTSEPGKRHSWPGKSNSDPGKRIFRLQKRLSWPGKPFRFWSVKTPFGKKKGILPANQCLYEKIKRICPCYSNTHRRILRCSVVHRPVIRSILQ